MKVGPGGRIVIPAEVRRRLGIGVGSELAILVREEGAVLMNAKNVRAKARERVRRYVEDGSRLSEELLTERRQEERRE